MCVGIKKRVVMYVHDWCSTCLIVTYAHHHHHVHVQITMSASELYRNIEKAMQKKTQAGDDEAVSMLTAAVVLEAPDNVFLVSAISACITGIFKAARSPCPKNDYCRSITPM